MQQGFVQTKKNSESLDRHPNRMSINTVSRFFAPLMSGPNGILPTNEGHWFLSFLFKELIRWIS
jgi:hypothetical protein